MSRRVSTNNAYKNTTVRCHVCEKAGENRTVYEGHNFRDHKGRVCCTRFLGKLKSHTCGCCGLTGKHFTNQCREVVKKTVATTVTTPVAKSEPVKVVAKKLSDTPSSGFAALYESSSEEEAEVPLHPNVTLRRKPKNFKSWADCESSDDEA